MSITQAELLEMLEYRNGELYWKKPNTNRLKPGDKAGSMSNSGYHHTMVKGKLLKTHRLIFLMFNGYLPECVDHINNNPADNRIENLRAATKAENCRNSRKQSDNKSGTKNVHWHGQAKMWRVQLTVDRKILRIGMFKDKELAELVAYEAREKFHGKFANHGAIAA